MNRGNLVLYDSNGKIWLQTGEATGDIKPHIYPVGISYIEVLYGSTEGQRIVSVDVSVTPHKIVKEDIEVKPSYEDLENKKIEWGGIF